MTLKELQSGTKFKYGHTSYYSLETLSNGDKVVCQFGQYLANIEKMTEKYIYAYTYVMNQKVGLKIDISKCVDMEQELNKDYQIQEMYDEYGIGAYEEEA
jgi:hypothetical protein